MPAKEFIGILAAIFTTCAFIPQVWRVWRTQHTQDISLLMYAMFSTGVALWLIYGVLLGSWPIMIANAFTLLLASSVLVLKLRFG